MGKAKVVSIIALAIIGILGYRHFHPPMEPFVDREVAVQLARQHQGSGFCGDPEYRWPCLVVTDVSLSSAPYGRTEHRQDGTGYRYCFDIQYQAETTPWDSSQGIPSEPRSYTSVYQPARQCARINYWHGDRSDPASWSYGDLGTPWYRPILEQLTTALCSRSYPGEYNCPTMY